MTKKTTLYSEAFKYAVRGYSVMPLKSDKRPALTSWKKYQTAPADESQIETWWSNTPDALIGIVTGKVSGITVIDIDSYKEGGTKVDAFPPTYTVKTGNGGYHLYYKYVEGLTISANAYAKYPGVDIRSDGGYIVAPPSVTNYNGKGGPYTIEKNIPLAPFPIKLFPTKHEHRGVSTLIGKNTGSRNDAIAIFAGQLLRAAPEKEWGEEVWPSVQRANETFKPPLSAKELKTTFDSIVGKEKARRAAMVVSPIQLDNGESVQIPIRRNSNGSAYKDMTNAIAVLQHHPYFKGNIKYNEFRQEIEYKGRPIEDADYMKIQHFMQKNVDLPGIKRDAIDAAISYYAHENSYDEAKDWLTSLKWDKKPRLLSWIPNTIKTKDDNYHQAIGAHWFTGMIRRIMEPGCLFDYVLVLVGKQGIGKTSLFRIIGGPWYKAYGGAIDNKDFYLALRGAMLVDLDEGSTLNKSDSIRLKSVITSTHDEYRAPYDRTMKKYPRRFVFSMSTNDTEPLRDVTGNRRYWTIDGAEQIDFKWLQENRDQIFAEAYHYYVKGTKLPEIPHKEANENQEMHLPDDTWTDLVMSELQKNMLYCSGSDDYFTTITEIFKAMFPEENLARLGRIQEIRIASIFRKEAGLDRKRTMIDGELKWRWYISEERKAKLRERNAKDTRSDFEKYDGKEHTKF